MESKKCFSSFPCIIFSLQIVSFIKKHWLIIWPISPPLYLERMWAMSRGTICSGPFYIGYKKWSLSQTTTLFFVKTNWLLSFGSELRALDFLRIDKKTKSGKEKTQKNIHLFFRRKWFQNIMYWMVGMAEHNGWMAELNLPASQNKQNGMWFLQMSWKCY